jgi:hypothetical protein
MKIEISEVFITRADSITMDAVISPIGIAALEPTPKTGGWGQRLSDALRNTFGTRKRLKQATFSNHFEPAQKQCAEHID